MHVRPLSHRAGLALTLASWAALMTAGCSKPAVDVRPDTAAQPSQAKAKAAARQAAAVPSNPLKEAYFGEQHVHTAYSLDAFIGGTRLTPDAAYKFARGAEVELSGVKFKLNKPLDWAAVTDHAEYIGEMYSTLNERALGGDNAQIKELRQLQSIDEREAWFLKFVVGPNRGTPAHPPFYAGADTTKSGWQVILKAAADNYEPGKFTTLPAYEWSGAPNGGNLHRNVFFRDIDKVPEQPMSYIDIGREDGLWRWQAELEKRGIVSLAIAHNSNASKGQMFDPLMPDGKPLTAEYAALRNKYERAIEMMQIKGNSEVHRSFWAADEFANFENADSIGDYSGRTFSKFGKSNWVRYGLAKGLAHEQSLGVNPYQYGIVGGTDSHNGTPSNVDEGNFMAGSHGAADGTVERRRDSEVGGWIKGRDMNPGALTAVWAPKNTREAIFDGLSSRETFATSGPRVKVRFFGRLASKSAPTPTPADARKLVEEGYAQGVPMGGSLKTGGLGGSGFTVWAMKEADGANLDRIQIIKAWVDAKGEPQDRVYDVVWSGDRKPDAKGKLAAVGNTVDLKTASYTNTIGSAELMGAWADPSFDPKQHAVYYARVLLIPTPRWSTYDAVRSGLPLLEGVAATVQERAWTSPIWIKP